MSKMRCDWSSVSDARGRVVADRCRVAATPAQRLRGLLGRPALRDGEGLLLSPCASVHTLFLRHPIEVVFLAADGAVLRVVPHLRPWRGASRRGARSVLELPPGTCARAGIGVGDRLAATPTAPARTRTSPARRPRPRGS